MENVKEFYVPKLKNIIDAANLAEGKLNRYLKETKTRPDISYELLQILTLSDDLVELFNPTKSSGEYFGLPKEVVMGSKFPRTITLDNGIDFTSWFAEKTTNIKLGIKRTIKYWEMNPNTLKLVEDAPMSVEDYILDGIFSGLHQVKTYATTICDMLEQ